MSTDKEINVKLLRWLEGDLSGEELAAFEASAEFADYQKIIDSTDGIEYPVMDEDAVFKSIQQQIKPDPTKSSKSKVILLRNWIAGIAAVAVLAFAVMTLLPNSVNISSEIGQYVSHKLPDGSKVDLNGNSRIHYDSDFEKDKLITLEGEAFFEVTKGASFEVKTDLGTVSVLGTSFNVFSRNDIFTVACKTGKVKVESRNQSVILQKGERVVMDPNAFKGKELIDPNKIGKWVDGESTFTNATLNHVVAALTSEYDIQIDLPEQFENRKISGSFVHDDINKALKMVFSPMGISYTLDKEGNVLISAD